MMNFQLIRIPVHAVEENRSWISDGFVSCCYPGFDGWMDIGDVFRKSVGQDLRRTSTCVPTTFHDNRPNSSESQLNMS